MSFVCHVRRLSLCGLLGLALLMIPAAAAREKGSPQRAERLKPTTSTAQMPAGLAPDSMPPPVDGPALSSSPTAPAAPATVALLRRIEAKNAGIKTVHATFNQTRRDEVYLETVESQGELWFIKPDQLRVDYIVSRAAGGDKKQAKPVITLVTDNTLYSYVPEMKQVNYLKFASDAEREAQLHHYLMGFGFKTEELLRHYAIRSSEAEKTLLEPLQQAKADPAKIALLEVRPRPEYTEATPFTQMQVWFDKTTLLPVKIFYKEAGGADITLDMENIEFDKTFDGKQFNPKSVIPSDVEYINQREKAQ